MKMLRKLRMATNEFIYRLYVIMSNVMVSKVICTIISIYKNGIIHDFASMLIDNSPEMYKVLQSSA